MDAWFCELSEEARQAFNNLLKDLRKTRNPQNWIGFRGFLSGKYKQERIWELGFYADKKQYRVLGVFGNERRQAILLAGCHHKQGVYTPTSALDTAFARSRALSRKEAILYERKIEIDI